MLLRLVNSPEMRQRLNITPEQADKIRQQTTEFMKGQIRNRADLEIQRLDLRNLLAAEHPDRTAIDATLQKMSDVRLAQEKSAVDFHLTMRDAFTPEQQQKLREMRRAGMHGRFGGGRMLMRGPHRPAPMGGPGTAAGGNGPGQN
jgi:Spy/CpxP family protein refolding chaperone